MLFAGKLSDLLVPAISVSFVRFPGVRSLSISLGAIMSYTHDNPHEHAPVADSSAKATATQEPTAFQRELHGAMTPPADANLAGAKPSNQGPEQAQAIPGDGSKLAKAADGSDLNNQAAGSAEARMSNEAFDQLKDKGWAAFAQKDLASPGTDGKSKDKSGGYDQDGALDFKTGGIVLRSSMASNDSAGSDVKSADRDNASDKPNRDGVSGQDRAELWQAKVADRVEKFTEKADLVAEASLAAAQAQADGGNVDLASVKNAERIVTAAMTAGDRRGAGDVATLDRVKADLERSEKNSSAAPLSASKSSVAPSQLT